MAEVKIMTPRGPISKKRRDEIDEAAEPIIEITPGVGTAYKADKAARGAGTWGDVAKSAAIDVVTFGAGPLAKGLSRFGRGARAAKDLKAGDMRSQVLNKGKPQAAADAGGSRASFLEKAKKGEIKAKKTPAKDLKSGDQRSQILSDAKAKTAKAKPAKAETAKTSKSPVKKNEAAPRPAKDYQSNGSLRREFLDKVDKGEIRAKQTPGATSKVKTAAKIGAGAAAIGGGIIGYRAAGRSESQERKPSSPERRTFGDSGRRLSIPGSRVTSEAKTDIGGGKASPKEKMKRQMQGTNPEKKKTSSSGTTPPKKIGSASDKSRLATKKPSNFERMKMRSYEKEAGVGPSRARSKVSKERGYKFKDLFK